MKYLSNTLLLILFNLLIHGNATAQGGMKEEMQAADSALRSTLKDSLQVSDETVTALFSIRDGFFNKSNEIYANGTPSIKEQDSRIRTLRKETNESIKALLGNNIYNRYVQMIEVRIRKRNSNKQPLALYPN